MKRGHIANSGPTDSVADEARETPFRGAPGAAAVPPVTTRRAWAVAALGLVVAGLYLGYFVWLAAAGRFRPVDFEAFYTGAALLRDGHGARLYDLGLQARYQIELLGRLPLHGNVLPFVSPPHVAVALLPLAYLPLGAAFAAWSLLQLVLVACLARECVRPCGTTAERAAVLGALAAFPMLLVTLYKGQLSLVVLVSLLAWIRALGGGRDSVVALALLVGTVKPQMILVPLVITACLRRGRALAIFAAGGFLLVLLAAVVAGPSSWVDFLEGTQRLDVNFDHRIVYPASMYNFKGMLVLLLGVHPALIGAATRLALLLALVAAGALFWRRGRDDETLPLRFALALLLGIFFSLHLYYYDALLLVAVAVSFDAHLRRFAPGWRPAFLGLAYAVPLLFLEAARINLDGRAVRWPAAVMVGWMLVLAAELVRTRVRLIAAPARHGHTVTR